MVRAKEYAQRVEHQYPPRSKTDLVHLVKDCSVYYHDWRNLFDVLTDIEYRVVTPDGAGIISGFKHDRSTEEFTVLFSPNDSSTGSKTKVEHRNIVKLEPVSTPSAYL